MRKFSTVFSHMADVSPVPFYPIPDFSGTYDDALSILVFGQFLDFAALTLVVYNSFITLEEEIRLVWRGRWGIPTLIYMFTHYAVIPQATFTLIGNFYTGHSMSACSFWNRLANWSVPFIILSVEAMLVLRTSALYEHDRRVYIPLWITFLCATVSMFAIMGVSLNTVVAIPSPAPTVIGCKLGGPSILFWAIWIPSLILEATMLLLTMARAIYYKQNHVDTPVLTVLVRDGFVYFLAVFALMLAELIIAVATSPVYYSVIVQLAVSICTVLCSRLFLNLREVAYRTNPANFTDSGKTYELEVVRQRCQADVEGSGPSSLGARGDSAGWTNAD